MKKEVISHLKGDIKTFEKEKRDDQELIKKLEKPMHHKKAMHHLKKAMDHMQSHASRMDESLGIKHGKESGKKQSYASRRHESKGARGK